MNRADAVDKLRELARLAYWYGERTGDYNMTSLFEEDEEAMAVAELLIAELTRQNSELMAQVEQLRTVIDVLVFGADRKFIDGEMTYMIPANHISSIGKAFGKEPAQCLAEIEAKSFKEGYIKGVDNWCDMNSADVKHLHNEAEEYANQIRQQSELSHRNKERGE